MSDARFDLDGPPTRVLFGAGRRVARALGADDGAAALHHLAVRAGAATSPGALGLRADQVDGVAERVAAAAPAAPREVSAEDVRGVLHAALAGRG